jgi:hypothetical protein
MIGSIPPPIMMPVRSNASPQIARPARVIARVPAP